MSTGTVIENGDSGAVVRQSINRKLEEVDFADLAAAAVIDDDTMATATDTTVATSESIKAYVDGAGSDISVVTVNNAASPYTVLGTEDIIQCDCVAGAITLNWTSAATTTRETTVQKIDASANLVTVDASGAETINGTLTVTIGVQYNAIEVYSDLTNLFWK